MDGNVDEVVALDVESSGGVVQGESQVDERPAGHRRLARRRQGAANVAD